MHAAPRRLASTHRSRPALAVLLTALLLVGIAVASTLVEAQTPAPAPTTVRWGEVQAQPFSNSEGQSEVVGGRLYSFGGFDSTKGCCTPTDRAFSYDAAANAWTALAPMPAQNGTGRGGVTHAGMTSDGTNIFWAGGYTADSAGTGQIFGTREVWRYNVAANTYTRLADLPVARAAGQLEYVAGKLHFFGGTNLARSADTAEHWELDLGTAGATWQAKDPLPNARHHMGAAVLGGRIYAIGGQHGHDGVLTPDASVHAYDPATNAWTERASLPAPRNHITSSTVVQGGRILVIGGQSTHGTGHADVFSYDPAANAWGTVTSLPSARHSAVAGVIADRIYLSTGGTAQTLRGIPDPVGLCEPNSDLACADVKANLPLNLGWSAAEGGYTDRDGQGTGFTMVQPSTTGAYLPELLNVDTAGSRLVIRTTKGIQYKTPTTTNGVTSSNNNLDNGLGIGVGASKKLRFETTLVNPPGNGNTSAQGGLWFGPDQDNYVKLVVASAESDATPHKIQMVREVGGASATADEVNTLTDRDYSAQTVRLVLVADPGTGKVTGSYRVGTSTAETALGELTVPASFFDGSLVAANARGAGSTGFAGIFATHRNTVTSTGLDFAFGEFTAAESAPPVQAGNAEVAPARLVTNDDVASTAGAPAQTITIRNTGAGTLTGVAASISGSDASQWTVTRQPDTSIPEGGSTTAEVTFRATTTGPKGASLDIASSDPDAATVSVGLRGLGATGLGGSNEPSLQWILDTYEIPVTVGDDNAATNVIHSNTTTQKAKLLGNEITAQTFRKAPGTGSVTVEPLAVFGPDAANPIVRFGSYTAGSAAARNELFTVGNSPVRNAQTLNVPGGIRAFDPGTSEFGLYSIWPFFDGRQLNTEDALNTFTGAIPHHVRTYPLKTAAGAVEPNAYVVATEEHVSGFDYQDVVAIVRNVEPVAVSSNAEIAVENVDEVPFADRLAFSRIQTPVSTAQGMHDTARLRVRNTGTDPLSVRSASISGPWELVTPPSFPAAVAPGGTLELTVRFTAQTIGSAGGYYQGSLTLQSNDTDESTLPVELAGFWQSVSEGGQEPDVDEVARVFGYRTNFGNGDFNNRGRLVKLGEEVHSAYWKRADTAKDVVVRQLAALHGHPGTATFSTTNQKTGTTNPATQSRLTHYSEDAQSLLPRKGDTNRTPGKVSITPAQMTQAIFGFKVDGEWSDWTINNKSADDCTDPAIPCGHHVRFWPARDRAGALIPHTYLMVMDYSGINYDFNDNIYLISNVRPIVESEDPSIPKPCTPLACDQIKVTTPYALDFGTARTGTILDKDDQGTGFTHVDKPSNATGYLKPNLDLDTTAGQLAVATTAGLNFAANNSLDNGLAVGLPFPGQAEPTALAIRTRLVDLPAGTQNNQQGGLWFGRNEDNYVKLVVISGATGTRIQLLRETGGLSDGTADQVTTTGAALNVAGQAVSLELLADPATRRVTGTYTLPGQSARVLGSFVVDPAFFSQDPSVVDERIGTSSFAGILASHRQGPAPLVYRFDGFSVEASAPRPSVTASRPADGATGVLRDESISTDLSLPNAGGIDNSTLTADTVRLVRASDGTAVPANRGTSGGGDVVNLDPSALLDANTQYRFEITDGLKDASGQPFLPYTATFTTGATTTDTGSGTSTARFERVALPTATAPYEFYSGLTMGPDGKLYAGMIDGRIRRFAVAADGTLGAPETITTLVPNFDVASDATKRALVGIRFEPGSTASNPVLWVSHATFGFENMSDWGGVITRLSGADLDQRRDVITGLPRSTRDHLTNGIDFGPDGALYFNQGSINAMGRGDNSWAQTINGVKVLREERALSAATLRLDTSKVTGTLDVRTEEGGSYDPFAPGAPLTVFASGIRNAYDLVWHSNGQLYVPTNGSAAGGNTPGTPSPLPASCSPRMDGTYTGPSVPALSSIGTTQHDYLFRAVQGGYYGHPNPKRCEWVLNGGNPTSAVDRAEVTQYPVGTQPDRNWRGAAYDFGLNKSPNGVVEYTSTKFGGTLRGKLLVVRYSNSNDVIALTPGGASQDIVAEQTGIPGLSSTTQPLKDPLDITEDTRTGNLYVSEYDQTGQGQRILLLRAQDTGTTPTDCAPNSTLSCAAVKAAAPKTMEFDKDEGGLDDADGQGTGFTMVQPSSNGGAFLPGRLDVDPAGSKLTIRTTRGIQFKTATTTTNGNSLDNGLGVGFDATRPTTIETTLVNPPLGTGSSEQAGVWFGPDEDNYAKLVIASAKNGTANKQKVQLLREVAGASVLTTDPATTDELNSTAPANEDFSGQTVQLTLVTDPSARTVTGSYRVGTGAVQTLGTLAVPASFFDGSTVAANARTAGSTGFAGIFASHRNNTTLTGLDYVFGRFALTQANQAPSLTNPGPQSGAQGETVALQIQASDPEGGALQYEARGLPSGLTMNPSTGLISGTITDVTTLGDYDIDLRVTDLGTPNESATARFTFTVTAPAPVKPLTDVKVNFQNEAAPVPTGYLRDFGEGYGPRTGAGQGTGYAFGWVAPGTSTPRSLTTPPNGRDRNLNPDQRLDTLMHMQGNDVPNFSGTPLPASWEIAAPDGQYRVTVAVGDPSVNQDVEAHTINVEGVNAITRFAPTGAAGSATHHQVATLEKVTVTDGRLTLDAIGGTNTKINYVDIAAVANTAPVVTKPADRSDREGDAVSLQVEASDAESPNLVYSATNLPAGLSIDGDEGLISGTVAAGAATGSPYTVTVKATDTALPALSGEQTFTWTVTEADGPRVESTTPAADASGVAVDTTLEAVFSEPVVNVNATTFTLRQGTTAVDATVSLSTDGRTASLDPAAPLEGGKAYTATVKGGAEGVRDAAGNPLAADRTWTFTTFAPCDPYSTRSCAGVKVDLPYERSFGAAQGGLVDKDGDPTGFTMVQPSGQNTATDPIGSGYVPGALDLDAASGRLSIDAGLGIQFKNPAQSSGAVNQQKNALGVGFAMPRKLRLETTLVNPPLVAGTGAEQAGLWFGPDQDHYVKLVVGHQGSGTTRSHRINFLREKGAIVPAGTAGEINVPATGTGPNYSTKSVKLILELDSRSGGRAEAFFEVDGTRTRVGAFDNLGAEFFDGSKLTNPGLVAAGAKATAGIFATKRNTTSTAPVVFTFDDVALSSVNTAPVVTMGDREDEAGSKVELPVTATDADGDRLTYAATGLPAGLSIDPATGIISGTAPAARTEPYAVTVTATDDGEGTKSGSAAFAWTIGPRPTPDALTALKVNFEAATTATPEAYAKDSGQAYGSRGTAGRYGWVRVGSNTGLDLALNARERTGATTPDLRFRTLMHMQGDDLPATFTGTRVEGAWEVAVPDGMYDVTVAVGDPTAGNDPQRDSINVEGVKAIDRFDATGIPNYTPERHKTASVTVPVTDGRLTLDAIGGTNTKIDFVEIAAKVNRAPVVTAPADTTVREGQAVDLTASASDADGDAVAFSATGLPAGLSIHPDTGAITGTPTAAGTSTVTVKATDDGVPAKSGEDAFELTVLEGTAPTVTEVSPAVDATGVAVDATIRATFSEPVRAGVGSFTLQRGSEAVAAAVTMSDDRRVATLTPSAPLAHAAAYTATVRDARDDAGNAQAAARTWSFKTLNRAPRITAPGSQTAREGTAFTLDVLAEDPDAGQAVTLSAASLPEGLTMSAAGRISGTVARGEAGTRTVTLTARDDFDPSASSTETFSLEVLEGTAPTVTSVSPADGATGVATGADVVATFSEPVKAGVELGLAKGTAEVAGTVTLNAARTQATFDPAQPLEFLTEYTATVAAAQDDAGNALASARAWTFRTADRPNGVLSASPASVAFASTETGAQRTQEVVLRNTADAGAKSITVSSVTVAGTDAAHFSDDEGGTLTLAPGESETVVVTFAPTTTGTKTASLVAAHSGANASVSVALSGTAVPPAVASLTATPAALDLGDVEVDATAKATVTVRNTGTATATVGSVSVTGADAARFTVPTGGFTLAPDATKDLEVTFAPTASGARTAALVVDYGSAAGSPLQVALSGTGTPKPVAAPAVRINAGGPAQTVDGTAWSGCSSLSACGGRVSGGFAVTKSPTPVITGAVSPANATTYVSEWTGGQTNGVPAGGTAFTFDVPVDSGQYDVRLHFAENHQNGAGKRLFDVRIEGATKLSSFDIFAETGGMHRATVREFRTSVTDGKATIQFIRRVENAAVMGIELVPVAPTDPDPDPDTTAPGPVGGLAARAGDARVDLTWTNPPADFAATRILRSTQGFAAGPEPAAGQTQVYEGAGQAHASTGLVNGTRYYFTAFARDAAGNWSAASTVQSVPIAPAQAPIRINSGGPALTVGGVAWRACSTATTCAGVQVFGGFPYKPSPVPTITGAVAPASAAVYQDEWTGGQTQGIKAGARAFGFDIPVINGTYLVRLHFAENNQTAIGRRLFDVQIEGGPLELSRFDIYAQAGGMRKAIVREFTVNVTGGELDLDFIRQVENAKVDGIEVIAQPAGTQTAASASALSLTSAQSTSGSVTVSGQLSASGATLRAVTGTRRSAKVARRIVLEGRRTGSTRWRTVAVAVAGRTGTFTGRVSRLGGATVLRARYSGDRHVRPAVSRGIRIRPGA